MKLIQGDCFEVLKTLPKVKCIFLDPPDNIGLDYDGFIDRRPDYIGWLSNLIWLAQTKADIVWCSFNAIHDLNLSRSINVQPGFQFKRLIWSFTFGQYKESDFANNYRPIFRLIRNEALTYPDLVREESERMRINDKRSAGPRVPGDVWDFPRVTGNSKERQSWHPTQHPVALYDRIIKFSCGPGDTFLDLFAGSGTCFRAGLLNPNVNIIGIEISPIYVEALNVSFQKDRG